MAKKTKPVPAPTASSPVYPKRTKILLSFTPEQSAVLAQLMARYGQTSRSALFSMLMYNDMNRKSVGRPRMSIVDADDITEPGFSDDLPKTIYWAGKMIGKQEMKYLEDKQKNFPQALNG